MAMLVKLLVFASMAMPLYAQTITDQVATHFQAAKDAEKRNDFPAAVHQYEYLASVLPRNAEMQSNLGVALYFDHEMKRAIAVFQRAIALNPNLLAPHLFSGLAWYQLSNPDSAVPELEKAVHIHASDVVAHTWLGYAYVAQFRYEAAVKEFQAACDLESDNVDAWYALGQSYLQIGKDATLELLAIAPDGGRVWQLAGEQFQLRGEREKALDVFKRASERRPDIPELRAHVVEMGGTVAAASGMQHGGNDQEDDFYHQAHDAEEKSRAAFERVVQIAPESYRSHQIMADALVAERRPDEAIHEYRAVLNLKPDLPGIHEAIGNILVRSEKLAEALKEFEAELEIQPRSATAHMNAGRVLLLMGDDARAGTMLSSALQLDRPPLETYVLLGQLDLRRNDFRSAISVLKRYTSAIKGNSNAYYLLARAYRGAGDKEQMNSALDSYKKVSQDAKERNLAQKELEVLSGKDQAPGETTSLKSNAEP